MHHHLRKPPVPPEVADLAREYRATVDAILEVLQGGMGDSKYRPCPLLRKYVEAQGQKFIGWRPVPTDAKQADIGASALALGIIVYGVVAAALVAVDSSSTVAVSCPRRRPP